MILPISVIIPTMNRPNSLDKTLRTMAEACDIPQEIIVVDQSGDEITRNENCKVLNSYECIPSKIYIYQQIPSSTKARNNGLTRASNDIVVFSDDDVEVPIDVFTNISHLMRDENIVLIAGIDELDQQSKTHVGYFLGTKSYFNRKIGHVTFSMLSRYPDNINTQVETQWAQGYFFVVRKCYLDKWNIKWDENLTSYAYAEDLDFTYTYYKCARKEGLRCILDPSVHVKHLATLEFRVPSVKSIYMYIVNRKYLSHKHKMGVMGVLGRNWCEFWRFIQHVISRQHPRIFFKAYLCKFKYSKDIKNGKLDYDKFMNSK